jgi:hypothetical protein
MYRYSVDNVITYTPDDLVLFRESPFAVWMERLTLDNPEHGIPPDVDGTDAHRLSKRQDAIVATLRAEGRNVVQIDAQEEEPERRIATLETMRAGADFIVGAHLSVENFAGTADMLMRTSGFSELGDFLYIPCETHTNSTLQSSFRLCFIADLLANLQGQLPPQLLIIRDGAEVVPLQTDDHIYYYRAVQRRFMAAMQNFRKHRMPDPAESAHFGRWAECASEVLKQREVSEQLRTEEQQQLEEQQLEEERQREAAATLAAAELPQLRVASGSGARTQFDTEALARSDVSVAPGIGDSSGPGTTLAEQASRLKPDTYRSGKPPGHTPSLARIGRPLAVRPDDKHAAAATAETPSTSALENLEFIGSAPGKIKPDAGKPDALKHETSKRDAENRDTGKSDGRELQAQKLDTESDVDFGEVLSPAPAPNLREVARRESTASIPKERSGVAHLAELEPRAPVFLPPDDEERDEPFMMPPPERLTTRGWEEPGVSVDGGSSVIDMDSAPPSTLAPVVQRAGAAFERLFRDDPMFKKVPSEKSASNRQKHESDYSSFSNSLKTSEEFTDN